MTFVGAIPIAEIIAIPLTPFLIFLYWRKAFSRRMVLIFALIGLWLFGQVVTDIIRRTPTLDRMRGFAAITFFAADLACLAALLKGSDRRKVVFFIGYAIGALLFARFQPEGLYDFWKFGYSYGSMIIATIISCYFYRRRKYLITGLIFIAIISANLIFNYRSPILFAFVVMVLVLPIIPERVGAFKLLPRQGSLARTLVLAGMAVCAGALAQSLLHWATARGLAGEDAQQKNLTQEQSKKGILLGARPEIQVSWQAVMDSPIIGHGSWAKDPQYAEMLNDIQVENGIGQDIEDAGATAEGVIPAHSHLMGTWVWAGVLGAVFWVYIFWLVVKGIVRLSNSRIPLAPFYAWLLVWYLWAIPFSPFGREDRVIEAATLVILIDLLEVRVSAIKRPLLFRWARLGQVSRRRRLFVPVRDVRAAAARHRVG